MIELIGLFSYSYLIYTGKINFVYSLLLLAFVFFFSVMITTISILWEEYTNQVYKSKKEIFKLLLVIFLEPFFFHPIVVYASIKGNLSLLFGTKHAWGNMGRMGIDDDEPPKEIMPQIETSSQSILKAS
jgi:hypothetical protein